MSQSNSPPLMGGNVYRDWEGTTILIQVGNNVQYLLKSSAGADITKDIWSIKKVVQVDADTDFTNLPTTRDYYPLDTRGFPSTNPEFKAKDYATYTYV